MGDTVIAFIFPEPEDSLTLGRLIAMCKGIFEDIPDVQIKMAVGDAAETIKFFVDTGELPVDEEEGNLVKHARVELARIGNDKDFDDSIIAAVKAFSSYGHSGGSASVAIPLLNDILNWKNLTSLTDDPNEWIHHEEDKWQSCRNPEAFSIDKGQTYYLQSEGGTFTDPNPRYETEKV